MLMPLGYAERDALVESILSETLRGGVHYADEFVIVAVLFVKQRRGMLRIEAERRFQRIPVVREVVHLLRDFGMKILKPSARATR